MAINKGNIKISSKEIGDVVMFTAELLVKNDNQITKRVLNGVPKKNRAEFIYNVEHTLAMSLIAHIYGDLIDPINELATLAGHHVTGDSVEELQELRQKIADILLGKIPEPDEKGVIITGN